MASYALAMAKIRIPGNFFALQTQGVAFAVPPSWCFKIQSAMVPNRLPIGLFCCQFRYGVLPLRSSSVAPFEKNTIRQTYFANIVKLGQQAQIRYLPSEKCNSFGQTFHQSFMRSAWPSVINPGFQCFV